MPITMRCISVTLRSAMGVLCLLVTTSGCATMSSIDVPWKKQTDASAGAESSETSDQTASSNADEDIRAATYWAQKAVSASGQIAYAQHLTEITEQNPELLAIDRSSTSDETASTGRSDERGGARKGEPTPSAPRTRTLERSDDDATAEATSAEKEAPEASTSDTETIESAEVRTVRRQKARQRTPSNTGANDDAWPVALQTSVAPTGRDHKPLDPTLETDVYDLTDADARETIADQFGIEPPDTKGAIAIPGTFLDPDEFEEYRDPEFKGFDDISEEQQQNQVAIVIPGERITVYAGEEEVAVREFEADADLPSTLTSVRPVRLIDDGTIQLLAYWPESNEDSDRVRYQAGVLKVIGPFVGTLFERTVAERETADAGLRRTGYVDFLTNQQDPRVRWIPADGEGQPDLNRAQIMEWNRWEGLFRVPETPPAAPDQRS